MLNGETVDELALTVTPSAYPHINMLPSTSFPESSLLSGVQKAWFHDIVGSAQPKAVMWLRSAADPITSDRRLRDQAIGVNVLTTHGVPAASITVADLCGTQPSHLRRARGHLVRLAEARLVSYLWIRAVDRLGRDDGAVDVVLALHDLGVRVYIDREEFTQEVRDQHQRFRALLNESLALTAPRARRSRRNTRHN
jgi:hypothetical protein